MNQADADKILKAEMKAILARGEPPTRIIDDYVRAGLMVRYPAIWHFLPRCMNTVFDKFIMTIDNDSSSELKTFIEKLPGRINISMDGATVNGKQKVCT